MITDLTQHQTYGSAEASRWCRTCQMSCSITSARRDAPTTSHCGHAPTRAFSRQRSARNERGGRAGFFSLGEWAVGILKRWCASQHHRNPLTSSPPPCHRPSEGLRSCGSNDGPRSQVCGGKTPVVRVVAFHGHVGPWRVRRGRARERKSRVGSPVVSAEARY